MDTQSIQRIKDLLSRSQRIVVSVGRNPSVDDMGAALGLYLSLQNIGKNVFVIAPQEPIVELSNLVGINKVKTRFEGDGADLVVSFPYKEGEIEKVSYTIENGFLNIVVKAGEQGLNFAEQDVKYTRGGSGGQMDVLFSIGNTRLSDLQALFSPEMMKDVTVVNIDNKQENQGFGDIVMVSPRFSSVSEQVAQLLLDLNADPDVDAAQNLLDGVAFATENFQSPRTSYLAFEMAGELMRLGAIRAQRASMPRQAQSFDQSPSGSAVSQGQSGQGAQARQQTPQAQQSGFQQPMRQPFDQAPHFAEASRGTQGRQQQNQPRPQQQQQQQQGQDRRQQPDQRRQPFDQTQGKQNQPRQQSQQNSQFAGSQRQPLDGTQNRQQSQFVQPAQQQRQNVNQTQTTQTQQSNAQPAQQQPQPFVRQPTDQGGSQTEPSGDLNPPSDWLTPKVYKGSSNV